MTDSLVSELIYDPETKKAKGVRVINTSDKSGSTYHARAVFLCASALASVQILLNTRSETMQTGLGNSHDVLGRYITDHVGGGGASGEFTGLEDRYYEGRRPSGFYIPRFRNFSEDGDGYIRGGAYQSYSWREDIEVLAEQPGFGGDYKHSGRTPGKWYAGIWGFGEMLPRWENRVSLNMNETDQWGLPLLHIDVDVSDNERAMSKQSADDAVEMLEAAGAINIERSEWVSTPGGRVHEMGGAVMGEDPSRSVTNKFNQLHDADNVFVTDGACFPSGGCQNPSISYMAVTARAAHFAADSLQAGRL